MAWNKGYVWESLGLQRTRSSIDSYFFKQKMLQEGIYLREGCVRRGQARELRAANITHVLLHSPLSP